MPGSIMHIRNATEEDLPGVLEIHNHAVRTLTAAWTTQEDSLEDRMAWLTSRQNDGYPVFVAVADDGEVLAFGTYGSFRARSGYRLTVEHSIYVKDGAKGKGLGRRLIERLIAQARADGYHAMVGAVDGQNEASLAFHKKLGFQASCLMPQVGMKFGRWLDLYLVTLLLDDRPVPPEE